MQVFVEQAGFHVVLQLDVQDVDNTLLDLRIQDRESRLYPAVQVPAHPIGGGQEQIVVAGIINLPDTGMFQKHIHDTGNPDIRTERPVGNQATNAPDNQVDLYAVLARII